MKAFQMFKVIRFSVIAAALATVCAGMTLGGCAGAKKDFSTQYQTIRQPTPQAEAINRYLAALTLERKGEFDKALEELKLAAERDPNSPTITLRLIRAHIRREEYNDACAMAEKAVELMPDNSNVHIVLGEIYHKLKRYEDAVEQFRKALELDPANVLGYSALLSIEESTNDLVASADIYRRLAELMPSAAGVYFQLGLTLARMNDSKGAREQLEKAIELKPDLGRARFILGVIHMEADENDAAITQFRKCIEIDSGDLKARENLAGVLARKGKYDEAVKELVTVALSKEGEPRHRVALMYLLLQAKRFRDADDNLPPEGAAYFGALFRAAARKGLGEPYRPVLDTLDEADSDIDAECTDYLNDLLFLFGREEAADYLIKMLAGFRTEGTRSKTVDLVLARVYMALDRDAEAETILLDALAAYPVDKWIHYYLATIYEKMDKIPETEEHLKAYLQLAPDDPDALNFLGYFYAERGIKLDEAEALLNKALEKDPENGFYLDSLGWIFYKRGNADKAIEYIRKAILAADNDDAELRSHLGDAYLLKGDTQRALEQWDRAYRLNPKLEGLQEKIDKYKKESGDMKPDKSV